MKTDKEKAALRKFLLENRDAISYDLIKISSKQIHDRLRQLDVFNDATSIAGYYPIGSEVQTQDIMQEMISEGKILSLPKVVGENIEFRRVSDFGNLEKTGFGIMEPKDKCPLTEDIDVVLVPTVGITRKGIRLGYGYGYYDRFLSKSKAKSISLTYSKQIVKSIPQSDSDVKVRWIVTENEIIDTLAEG